MPISSVIIAGRGLNKPNKSPLVGRINSPCKTSFPALSQANLVSADLCEGDEATLYSLVQWVGLVYFSEWF
jgi:hypothetical protein